MATKSDDNKPSIITHRNLLKEDATAASAEDEAKKTEPAPTKEELKPPSERAAKLEQKLQMPVKADVEESTQSAPDPGPEAKPEKTPEPEADKEPVPLLPDIDDDKDDDEVPGPPIKAQAAKTDDEDEDAIAAQKKHQASVEKLVESKKYFLPINTVEKRRAKHVVIIGVILSVVLLLAWANIALDAGLIQIDGVKPVTHFFST